MSESVNEHESCDNLPQLHMLLSLPGFQLPQGQCWLASSLPTPEENKVADLEFNVIFIGVFLVNE